MIWGTAHSVTCLTATLSRAHCESCALLSSVFCVTAGGRPGCKWTHEDMSLDLLEFLVEENNVDVEKDDLQFMKDVIIGSKRATHTSRSFLYEVVANGRNGIDVDKFDYLARDTFNIGIPSSYDARRLMEFSRVVGDEICYHVKDAYQVYELFHTRYSLHKTVYSHRAGRAIDFMITDALIAANPVLHLTDAIHDPGAFWRLTDCVLQDIANSKDEELAAAQQIVTDIRRRKLYTFVDEQVLPVGLTERLKIVHAEDISTCNVTDGVALAPGDIVVNDTHLDYTNKDKDPMENIHFYSSAGDTEGMKLNQSDITRLAPKKFRERVVRVFSRSPSRVTHAAIRAAFREFLRRCGMRPHHTTLVRGTLRSPRPTKRRRVHHGKEMNE